MHKMVAFLLVIMGTTTLYYSLQKYRFFFNKKSKKTFTLFHLDLFPLKRMLAKIFQKYVQSVWKGRSK